MNLKIKTLLLLFISVITSYGQMEEYKFKSELKGITETWHKLVLPDALFGKVSVDLSDIRIYGITAQNDTIEAPYLLHLTKAKEIQKEIEFKKINDSHNDKGSYYTFEIPDSEPINQMKVEFEQQNLDWKIKLEGSQDQSEWYTIIDNYRIVSIKNESTDFKFTKLLFPTSKYHYFRLHLKSKEKPELKSVRILKHEVTAGTYQEYPIKKWKTKESKKSKQTAIELELESPLPLSLIQIKISDTFNYYRPITIKYLVDSFKTEKSWRYNYATLTSGTLNSMEKNEFSFNSTTIQKLKIFIHNQDNQALSIDRIQLKGYIHELFARFTEEADYYLTYGNKNASTPQYDLGRFTDNIPKKLTSLEVGKESSIIQNEAPLTEPLFKNKLWLWILMAVIIITLAWFSIKMIKSD